MLPTNQSEQLNTYKLHPKTPRCHFCSHTSCYCFSSFDCFSTIIHLIIIYFQINFIKHNFLQGVQSDSHELFRLLISQLNILNSHSHFSIELSLLVSSLVAITSFSILEHSLMVSIIVSNSASVLDPFR